jgi:hypothetical protein
MADNVRFERDGRFLDEIDLIRDGKWTACTLTVAGITPRNHFINEQDEKPIPHYGLAFEETDKVLLMKATNGTLAQLALGDCREDRVVGKKVTLLPVWGKWTKGNYGVRIRYDKWREHGIQPHHHGKVITGQPVDPAALEGTGTGQEGGTK